MRRHYGNSNKMDPAKDILIRDDRIMSLKKHKRAKRKYTQRKRQVIVNKLHSPISTRLFQDMNNDGSSSDDSTDLSDDNPPTQAQTSVQ